MKFNEKIIQARKIKALTQEDLAEAVGVSRQAVSKWETGEANPDLDKLVAICSVLDLSMDYLCLDKEPGVTVEPAAEIKRTNGIRYLILGICIGLVAALLVGILAMGFYQGPEQTDEPSTTPQDYDALISLMEISDGSFLHVGEVGSTNTVKLTFVPSMEIPNVKVQVMVYDNTAGTTECLDVQQGGTVYYVEYTTEDTCNLSFYAVFTYEETSVDVPLYVYTRRNGSYILINSWEKN